MVSTRVVDVFTCGLQAISSYSEGLVETPRSVVLLANRSQALLKRNWLGDTEACLRDCDRVLQMDPRHSKSHVRRIQALHALKRYSAASQHAENATDFLPDTPPVRQLVALVNREHTASLEARARAHDYGDASSSSSDTDSDFADSESSSPVRRYGLERDRRTRTADDTERPCQCAGCMLLHAVAATVATGAVTPTPGDTDAVAGSNGEPDSAREEEHVVASTCTTASSSAISTGTGAGTCCHGSGNALPDDLGAAADHGNSDAADADADADVGGEPRPPSRSACCNNPAKQRKSLAQRWDADGTAYSERFIGHYNLKTDIKEANFFGPSDEFIVSGSDDGRLFIWDRASGNPVFVAEADSYILNCVQPHPFDVMLATSGIDNTIGIWEPTSSQAAPLTGLSAIVAANQEQLSDAADSFHAIPNDMPALLRQVVACIGLHMHVQPC